MELESLGRWMGTDRGAVPESKEDENLHTAYWERSCDPDDKGSDLDSRHWARNEVAKNEGKENARGLRSEGGLNESLPAPGFLELELGGKLGTLTLDLNLAGDLR